MSIGRRWIPLKAETSNAWRAQQAPLPIRSAQGSETARTPGRDLGQTKVPIGQHRIIFSIILATGAAACGRMLAFAPLTVLAILLAGVANVRAAEANTLASVAVPGSRASVQNGNSLLDAHFARVLAPGDYERRVSRQEACTKTIRMIKEAVDHILHEHNDITSEYRLAELLRTTLMTQSLHEPTPFSWDLQLSTIKEVAALCLDAFLNNQTRLYSSLKRRVLSTMAPFFKVAEETLFAWYEEMSSEDTSQTEHLSLVEHFISLALCGHLHCFKEIHITNVRPCRKKLMAICTSLSPTHADHAPCKLVAIKIPSHFVPEIVVERFVDGSGPKFLSRIIKPRRLPTSPDGGGKEAPLEAVGHRDSVERSEEAEHPPNTPPCKALRLPNGMKVVIFHDPEASHSKVAVDVRAGAYDDNRTDGLAHLIEHLVADACGKAYTFANLHGRPLAARTYSTHTTYAAVFPKSGNLQRLLKLFARLFLVKAFPSGVIQKEIEIIDREWSQKISLRSNDVALRHIDVRHPISSSAVGNRESLLVDDIDEKVREFLSIHYGARNMSLAICSAHSVQEMEEWIVQYFGQIPRGDRLQLRRFAGPLSRPAKGRYLKFYQSGEESIMFQWILPQFTLLEPLSLALRRFANEGLKEPLLRVVLEDGSVHGYPYQTQFLRKFENHPMIRFRVLTSNPTKEEVAYILRAVQEFIGTCAAKFDWEGMSIVGEGIHGEFVERAAHALGTWAAEYVPLVAHQKAFLTPKNKRTIRSILQTISKVQPQITLMTDDPPPDSLASSLHRDVFSTLHYSIHPVAELAVARPLSNSNDRLQRPESCIYFFLYPQQATFHEASKVILLKILLSGVARHYGFRSKAGAPDNPLMVTLCGEEDQDWMVLMSAIVDILRGEQPVDNLDRILEQRKREIESVSNTRVAQKGLTAVAYKYCRLLTGMDSEDPTGWMDPQPHLDLKSSDILDYAQQTARRSSVALLFTDSFPREIARDLYSTLFKPWAESLNKKDVTEDRINDLKCGFACPNPPPLQWKVRALSPHETTVYIPPCLRQYDSAASVYFEGGSLGARWHWHARDRSLFSVFWTLLGNHFTAQLREQYQLTYHVHPLLHTILGVGMTIQGEKAPDVLVEKITEVFRGVSSFLEELPDSILEKHIIVAADGASDAVIARKVRVYRNALCVISRSLFSQEPRLLIEFWPRRLEELRMKRLEALDGCKGVRVIQTIAAFPIVPARKSWIPNAVRRWIPAFTRTGTS